MTKEITKYSIDLLASANEGLQAQIMLRNETGSFAGRIDFYKGGTLPKSYLWHPGNPNDENNTYLVFAMWDTFFTPTVDLLRNEGPWRIELWPATPAPFSGSTTNGYGGRLKTVSDEKTGEGDFNFSLLIP